MHIPKVFLDTTVLKFSATKLPKLQPRETSINWGGNSIDVTVHDFVDVNPNDRITNIKLKAEAELLPRLAESGKLGSIEYVINNETLWESWGLPSMNSKTGQFYGAPIKTVKAPFEYSRILACSNFSAREMQYSFLCSIKHKRFLELQKITGAYHSRPKQIMTLGHPKV